MMEKLKINNEYYLRLFDQNDINDLYKALKCPSVVRHMAGNGFTKEVCTQVINDSLKHWEKYNIGSYAVIYNDRLIGWAGYKNWKNEGFEILCVLSPIHWGIGKIILDKLVDCAFNKFDLNSVLVLLPKTRKSFRAIQKYGFKYCGKEYFKNEVFYKFKINRKS